MEKALSLWDSQHPFSLPMQIYRVMCLLYVSSTLWHLGYSDQSTRRANEALTLAEELSDPQTRAMILDNAAAFHAFRREWRLAQERAEEAIALANEQGFAYWGVMGTMVRGGALAGQGQVEEGIAQMQQSLAAWQTIGAELSRIRLLPWLAAAYEKAGQTEEGLSVLAEALEMVGITKERWNEAEVYRIKGELTLPQQFKVQNVEFTVPSPRHLAPSTQVEAEAEACFLKAIEVARHQQARSLELRATVSLAYLWQRQGKRQDAHQMLADIYGWFTEGFDTKDLQDAKAILDELS
jgi:predicted ATPase